MTISVRKGTVGVARATVSNYNLLRGEVALGASKFHAEATTSGATTGDETNPVAPSALTVTAANATDLATSIALTNNIRTVLLTAFADARDSFSAGAHKAADTTNAATITAANGGLAATDLPSVEAVLNACKTAHNAHLSQAGVHITNDAANSVATVNATDQATSNALANAMKTAINAHMASAPAGNTIKLVDA